MVHTLQSCHSKLLHQSSKRISVIVARLRILRQTTTVTDQGYILAFMLIFHLFSFWSTTSCKQLQWTCLSPRLDINCLVNVVYLMQNVLNNVIIPFHACEFVSLLVRILFLSSGLED